MPQLYFVVKGRHSWNIVVKSNWSIVKASVEASCKHFKSWRILKESTKPAGPFGTMPQELWHAGKGAKPDQVVQLNCWELHTHASNKSTRTQEKFNNQGTKMIFLSDKLWLIANNSKSFENRSKWTIRNNLGLCKCSEIYLRTFRDIFMNLTIWKYRFGQERYIKQINNIWKWHKKTQQNFAVQQKKVTSETN